MIGFEDFVKVWNDAARDEVAHASLPPDASSFHHALYVSLQAMLGGVAGPLEASATTNGFVIQASSSTKAKPKYFAADDTHGVWTSDLGNAARYGSQEDAELVAKAHGLTSVVFSEFPA